MFQYLSAATTSVPEAQLPILTSKDVLIANDILLKALNAPIQPISQGPSMLNKRLADDPRVIAYREDRQKVMNGLSHMEEANNKEANQYLQMQQEIQHYETLLFPKLSKQVSAAAAFHP